jgi:hypothetical protein
MQSSNKGRDLRTAWLALLLLVAASRLLAIPSVPWEQDEALFAAAGLDTNLLEHRPHPPGFPLWIACAKGMQWLLGDPVVGLQLLSALASIVSVWLLGRAWSAVGGGGAGLAAAILYAFLPGVWFHAPRAFSTTPALACALAAVVCWQRRWLWAGTVAWVAAVLVRPPLTPPLVVLALAAAVLLRVSWQRLAVVAAVAAAAVTVGFIPLILDTGGLAAFLAATFSHGSGHAGALHLAPWSVGSLGVVRALGGLLPASIATVLTVLGGILLWRRDHRLTVAWLVLVAVTIAWIVGAHNRTYPRYTLPALALLAGPAGLAIEALWQRRIWPTLATAAVVAACLATLTAPAVETVATTPFPPLDSIAAACDAPPPGSIIVDGGLSPFGDLLGLAQRTDRPVVWRPLVAEGRVPLELLDGPWTFVWSSGTPRRWVRAPRTDAARVTVAGTMLERLSQDRYLTTWRSDRGAIVLEGPSVDEADQLLCAETTRLLVQPTPPGSWLGLRIRVALAPVEVSATLNGHLLGSVRLEPGLHPIYIDLPEKRALPTHPSVLELTVSDTPGTARCALERAWVDAPNRPLAAYVVPPGALPLALDGLVRATGLYDVEQLSGRPGRWTTTTSVLDIPVREGELRLALYAPRPGPVAVVMEAPSIRLRRALAIGGEWTTVRVPIPATAARVSLRLTTPEPLVPAETSPGANDRRTLGVVVGDITFTPRSTAATGG